MASTSNWQLNERKVIGRFMGRALFTYSVVLKTLSLLVLVNLAVGVQAERVRDLYQYSTLVSGQGSREYNQALDDGLAEVIVRSSGNRQVLQNPGILNALSRASRFLLEHYYENSDEFIEVEGREVPARRLVLEYSGDAIQKLLRELELPLWPDNRRNVLVWMAVDDSNGRRVATELTDENALQSLKSAAKQRGVPLVAPLMDLEDQVALSSNQLWTMSFDAIKQASERYAPDTVLAGRLSQTSRGEWRSDWQLMNNNKVELFDGQGITIEDAVAVGINKVADYFYQLYAIKPQQGGGQNAILFQVGGIEGFSDYKKALDYIEQLTIVRRADLVAVQDDNLLIYLYTDGDVKLLQDTLELDAKMMSRNAGSNDFNRSPLGSVENPLLYAWRP